MRLQADVAHVVIKHRTSYTQHDRLLFTNLKFFQQPPGLAKARAFKDQPSLLLNKGVKLDPLTSRGAHPCPTCCTDFGANLSMYLDYPLCCGILPWLFEERALHDAEFRGLSSLPCNLQHNCQIC